MAITDGKPPAEARDQALLDPGDLLGIRVAGDHHLLMRFDQSIEQIEELLLRARLVAEELDIVDEQEIERPVVAFELVERLVLVGAHDVGHVGLGMDVADPGVGVGVQNVIADRLDEMGLAQTDAAIDEQWVIRGRMLCDLKTRRSR